MADQDVYKGARFCGAVEVAATGEPAAVKITKGEANVGSYARTPKSIPK
jgi:hypothetical protein